MLKLVFDCNCCINVFASFVLYSLSEIIANYSVVLPVISNKTEAEVN